MSDNVLWFSVRLRQAPGGWDCEIFEDHERQEPAFCIGGDFCVDLASIHDLFNDCMTANLGACDCGSLSQHTLHGGEYRTGVLHPDTGEAELSRREWYACSACGAEQKEDVNA